MNSEMLTSDHSNCFENCFQKNFGTEFPVFLHFCHLLNPTVFGFKFDEQLVDEQEEILAVIVGTSEI